MRVFEIQDIKKFTTDLFLRETFDGFELFEADFTTFASFHIDGRRQKDYFDTAEEEVMGDGDFSLWKEMKPFCLSVIKGRRLPLSFKIILRLPAGHPFAASDPALLKEAGSQNLFLNIQYRNRTLTCTTGASAAAFVPGITPGQEWDAMAERLLFTSQA